MSGGLKLFHCIRRFGAALLSLSVTAAIGLAAETQVSFVGKTIRVVVPVASGGGLDLQSRALAPLLRAYIPGNPSVIVQNVAGAGGIVAGNLFMREQGPELTILQCHIGHPLYQLLGKRNKIRCPTLAFSRRRQARFYADTTARGTSIHEYR